MNYRRVSKIYAFSTVRVDNAHEAKAIPRILLNFINIS